MNRDDEFRPDAAMPVGDASATPGGEAGRPGPDATPDPAVDPPVDGEAGEGGDAERSEFSVDILAVGLTPDDQPLEGPTADRSRVDGMPDGWLDPPHRGGGDAAADPIGSDVDAVPDDSGGLHSSQVQIGTGQSGILSSSDVIPGWSAGLDRSSGAAAAADHEDRHVGDATDHPTEAPADHLPGDRDTEAFKPADDWGDIVADAREEVPSESIAFGAFLGAVDRAGHALSSDSFNGDSQGLEDGPGESIEIGVGEPVAGPVVAAAAVIPTAGRRAKPKGGGLGQLVGVVLGGVLAIPVTLAILIWGLGRDPFRLTRHVPESVSFLLPAKFQPRHRVAPRGAEPPAPVLAAAGTLDQLPTVGAPGGNVPEVDLSAAADVPAAVAPFRLDPPGGEPPSAPPAATLAADAVSGAAPADPTIGAPTVGGLGGAVPPGSLEPNPGGPGAPQPVAAPVAPVVDLTALDGALSRATKATVGLGQLDRGVDASARDRALVAWYRTLSDVAVELANAERASLDAGLPATAALERFRELRGALGGVAEGGSAAVGLAELADFGQMWLASERRPSDGTIVVGVLETSHPVGPWWGGRLSIAGEPPVAVSFLSRHEPGAVPGDRIIATGLLADAGTMWLVDCTPVSAEASGPDGAAEGDPSGARGDAAGALPGDDGF